eukprot:7071476-Alexandrium_andersonii.AAC.1
MELCLAVEGLLDLEAHGEDLESDVVLLPEAAGILPRPEGQGVSRVPSLGRLGAAAPGGPELGQVMAKGLLH